MRKSLLPLLACLLLLTSCKTDEEKVTDWILKDTSQWLVREMSYDYKRIQLSTVEESGIEFNNGVLTFNSDGTGSAEFSLAFLGGSLSTPFDWTTDGTKVYGDSEGVGAGGGTYVLAFEIEKTAKHGGRMTASYDYMEPSLTEELDLDIRVSRK